MLVSADCYLLCTGYYDVSEFVYLGALLTSNNDCTPEIKRRINLARQTVGMLKSLWVSGELTTKTKLDLMTSCVLSRLLYAADMDP